MELIKGDGPLTFEDARLLEQQGEYKKAASAYEKLLKRATKKIKILERLLIVFRRLKDVEKELFYIDATIKTYELQYPVRNNTDKKIATLSRQLNNILGHTDKKGKNILIPPEIAKLELRKARLLKNQAAQRRKK